MLENYKRTAVMDLNIRQNVFERVYLGLNAVFASTDRAACHIYIPGSVLL